MSKTILKVLAGAVFPVLMLVSACGGSSSSTTPTKPTKHVEQGANYTTVDLGMFKEVTFVESPDGTPCAVAFNEQSTSIDCAWEAPAK